MELVEMVGRQALPEWAVLEQLALMRFATSLLPQWSVHLELLVLPAAAVGLPDLAVLVGVVEPAALSSKLVLDLF